MKKNVYDALTEMNFNKERFIGRGKATKIGNPIKLDKCYVCGSKTSGVEDICNECKSQFPTGKKWQVDQKLIGGTSRNSFGTWLITKKLKYSLNTDLKSYHDVVDDTGIKYIVRGCRVLNNNSSRQLGIIYTLNDNSFDQLIALVFDSAFRVNEAYKIPRNTIKIYSIYSRRYSGYLLILRGDVLKEDNVEDITHILK